LFNEPYREELQQYCVEFDDFKVMEFNFHATKPSYTPQLFADFDVSTRRFAQLINDSGEMMPFNSGGNGRSHSGAGFWSAHRPW
jgi:hypothetical protein